METNYLGILATLLVVLVPSIFLVILYVQTSSRSGN
jgi:photosystem II PsbM protein